MLVKEITLSSIEQKSGADQINDSIQELCGSTGRNALSADKLVSNSQKMAIEAEELKKSVNYFTM
jgi:methyl-accepting chemotaxis protein